MSQLSLFATFDPPVVLRKDVISEAWGYLLRNMTSQLNQSNELCVYDLKLWDEGNNQNSFLAPSSQVAETLAHLYLTSELGTSDDILSMVMGGEIRDLIVPPGGLDEDVEKVIKSKKRFRHTLSEHLAFWSRLATAVQFNTGKFACSLSNVQPEDKGPDGLFVSIDSDTKVEIQSVKSSINNPQGRISTKSFRTSGRIPPNSKRKLLEDFHRFAFSNFGFTRLERQLVELFRLLDVPTDRKLRIALLSNTKCSYNAVVVANHQYACIELFEGYQFVTSDVQRRIATYIGSVDWSEIAEQTRVSVIRTLKRLGFLT
ncbi:MAG: hypothetical protein DRJ03_25420 [Chloroflexi bacterium]|nr:MAG: hypothetical protein DRJ03_25420 [Chloroflexota bacterium]